MAKRLAREHVKPYYGMIAMATVFLVLFSLSTTAQPLILQITFDKLFKEQQSEYLFFIPFAIIGIFLLQAVSTYFSSFLMGKAGQRFAADMQKRFYHHAISYDISFHSRVESGDLIRRLTQDILYIWNAVNMLFVAVFKQILTSLGLIAVMFYQSVELSLVTIFAFTFAVYPIVRITVRLRKLSKQLMSKHSNLISRLFESFSGIRVIKAYGQEENEQEKIDNYVDEIRNLAIKSDKVGLASSPIMIVLAGFAVAIVIWYGGSQLLEGKMTQGNLIAFITSLIMLSRPIKSLSNLNQLFQNAIVALERFYKIIDEKPSQQSKTSGDKLDVTEGKLAFENVSFSYDDEKDVLKNFDLEIPSGKKIAIVGHSGSGKSTLFNLLLKFYAPQSGKISIDGQDLSKVSAESLRNNIALVSQDSFIFDDTVANNIAIGKEEATEKEIKKAAKAANCMEFIEELPEGLNTKLGYFGQSLSGGQKQRLSIARAFVRDSKILLLDEATSALDPTSESKIQESLSKLTNGKTTLMIAHRLSTITSADLIVMVEGGEVVAMGTHEELLKTSEHYSNMFEI